MILEETQWSADGSSEHSFEREGQGIDGIEHPGISALLRAKLRSAVSFNAPWIDLQNTWGKRLRVT